MISIKPTSKQIELSKEYLNSWDLKINDYFNPSNMQRLFGIISQFIVSDFLKLEKPTNKGADGGFDILWNNKRWDIKTEIRNYNFNSRKFVHNLHAKQINNQVDGYIFVNYNRIEGIYEICGYIEKDKFIKYAEYYDSGESRTRTDGTSMSIRFGGIYEIKQKYLTKFKYESKERGEITQEQVGPFLVRGSKEIIPWKVCN